MQVHACVRMCVLCVCVPFSVVLHNGQSEVHRVEVWWFPLEHRWALAGLVSLPPQTLSISHTLTLTTQAYIFQGIEN